MSSPKFVIIGAGAVGGFVGVLLHDAGIDVRFLTRDSQRSRAQLQRLRKDGLRVNCSVNDEFQRSIAAADIPKLFSTDAAVCLAGATCVLVATKRTANASISSLLAKHSLTCPVVFLQNGLNIRADLDPDINFEAIESVVTFNVTRDAINSSIITLQEVLEDAGLVLDGKSPSTNQIVEQLARIPIAVTGSQELPGVQRGKLLLNMTNAVNALSGVPITPMFKQGGYRTVLAAAIDEAVSVFTAEGIPPIAPHPKDASKVRFFSTILRTWDWVFMLIAGKNLKGREKGFTSMAQDLIAHVVPTEILFLNGEVARLGQVHGISTPVNDKLVELLQKAEQLNSGSPGFSAEELERAVGLRK